MPLALPVSARLAWWGTAWLRGHAMADLAVDAVLGDDVTHVVAGLPGDHSVTLLAALAELRSAGATGVGLAMPTAGDPIGLGGPPAFNAAALDAGEACVAAPWGLVPRKVGRATEWTAHEAAPRRVPDLGEADRALRLALRDTTGTLAAMDVARWSPDAADALMDLHHPPRLGPPPGVPPPCADLAARSLQAAAIVDLALSEDGGAISGAEADARRAALVPLGAVARRGLVAACSPEAWPERGRF